MRTVIQAAMQANSPISSLLTGGIHTETEISRQLTPDAFDANGELLPCALVTTPGEFADGPNEIAGRLNCTIYFYQRAGYTVIDAARTLTRTLFHNQKVGDPEDRVWEMRWVNSVNEQRDSALDCPVHRLQFEIVRRID